MDLMFENENYGNYTKPRTCQIINSPIHEDDFQLDLAIKLKQGSRGLLTRKESLIASYLVAGYTVNEISDLLTRSKNTIKMHIKNMKKKCNCETQTRFGAVLQGFIKSET